MATQQRPPDPSQPNKMQKMIRDEISSFLSEPDNYPDPFVAWMGSFMNLTASSTGSITS
jgi:hypothetical protein